MKVICSFCNSVISEGVSRDDPIRQDVCATCYNRIFEDYGSDASKFFEYLDDPLFLVDGDARVLSTNSPGAKMAKKPVTLIQGQLCGDVLGCVNASHPSGCGKTDLCPDCTFRNTIRETYTTGKPVTRRPAVLTRKSSDAEEKIPILVSTRKEGHVVLLHLEPIAAS